MSPKKTCMLNNLCKILLLNTCVCSAGIGSGLFERHVIGDFREVDARHFLVVKLNNSLKNSKVNSTVSNVSVADEDWSTIYKVWCMSYYMLSNCLYGSY
jgi:hypothetical protein